MTGFERKSLVLRASMSVVLSFTLHLASGVLLSTYYAYVMKPSFALGVLRGNLDLAYCGAAAIMHRGVSRKASTQLSVRQRADGRPQSRWRELNLY